MLAAEVNCPASVAWRFSCLVAEAVVLTRARVKIEDNMMMVNGAVGAEINKT